MLTVSKYEKVVNLDQKFENLNLNSVLPESCGYKYTKSTICILFVRTKLQNCFSGNSASITAQATSSLS